MRSGRGLALRIYNFLLDKSCRARMIEALTLTRTLGGSFMLNPHSRYGGAMFAVIGLSFADAQLALAQEQTTEGIQEVVVTAQRREENLQTTPIAITAISADTLNKAGVAALGHRRPVYG